ncbi:hypothetical protein H4R21_004884, partial [Coemansia helicoidea]
YYPHPGRGTKENSRRRRYPPHQGRRDRGHGGYHEPHGFHGKARQGVRGCRQAVERGKRGACQGQGLRRRSAQQGGKGQASAGAALCVWRHPASAGCRHDHEARLQRRNREQERVHSQQPREARAVAGAGHDPLQECQVPRRDHRGPRLV